MAKKTKKRPKFIRSVTTLVFLAALISFCYIYIKQEIVLVDQRKQMERMQEENTRLEEEYQAKLKSDEDKNTLDYIDKYMRIHFGMIKDGETRVDVVEDGN